MNTPYSDDVRFALKVLASFPEALRHRAFEYYQQNPGDMLLSGYVSDAATDQF